MYKEVESGDEVVVMLEIARRRRAVAAERLGRLVTRVQQFELKKGIAGL